MKKYLSTLAFVLLLFTQAFGQAAVDIPIFVHDSTGEGWTVYFGLDLTATDGIDPWLGESDLPPGPPTNSFDVRWWLPPFAGMLSSWRDYRGPGVPPNFPFTGTKHHCLKFQTTDWPITITWDLPFQIASTSRIKDAFGGVIVNKVFAGTDSLVVTNPAINQLMFFIDYVNIGGDPNDPIFDISATQLTFPPIPSGSTDSLTLTISNLSLLGTLYINEINSSSSNFFVSPNSIPIAIGPDSSKIFTVYCTATDSVQEGTIEFVHNAYGSPAILNVYAPPGIQPGPSFYMNPTTLIFSRLPAGTVDSLPLTISNIGYQNTLYINEIISTNNNFSIYPNSVPIAIEPLSYTTFYVTCLFTDTLQQGTIEFTHNAPGSPSILNVVAVYSQAQFSVQPASRYYPYPGPGTFLISNEGVIDTLILVDILSSNSNYTISPTSFPISIPPGSSTSITVSLNSTPGFQFSIIEFFNNAPGSPHSVCVSNQIITPEIGGLLVVQSGSQEQHMRFGLDRYATDNIDMIFGENDIPPPPPPGAFDARYVLPENNFSGSLNSYNDCRYGISPFIEQREFRISYQPYESNGIEIYWYLPEEISGVLMDLITGNLINVPISDTGSFVVPNPTAFSKLKMLVDFSAQTPVELVSFTVKVSGQTMWLNWTTSTETNNSGFEINRKKLEARSHPPMAEEWNVIGFVPGFGTTLEPKSYSFIDEDVTTGTYKYRLKQIDYDGSFEYSNVIEVEVDFTPKEFVLYQNYPNPFNPSTTIKYEIPYVGTSDRVSVRIIVYDVLGNEVATLVNEEKQPGVYEVEFNSGNLSSGIYFYQLMAGSFSSIKKMVLLR